MKYPPTPTSCFFPFLSCRYSVFLTWRFTIGKMIYKPSDHFFCCASAYQVLLVMYLNSVASYLYWTLVSFPSTNHSQCYILPSLRECYFIISTSSQSYKHPLIRHQNTARNYHLLTIFSLIINCISLDLCQDPRRSIHIDSVSRH